VFKITEMFVPSLLLAAERVVERLSDDRVSPNEATLPLAFRRVLTRPTLRWVALSSPTAERGQRKVNPM
jgi:hypothetical protein